MGIVTGGIVTGGILSDMTAFYGKPSNKFPQPTIENIVQDSPWTRLKKQQNDSYEPGSPSTGLKGNLDYAVFIKQKAYQQVMEYIGKTAADGAIYSAIENGGNAFATIARRDSFQQFNSYSK